MTAVLIVFLGAATVLWLSVFGYLLALAVVALTRRAARHRLAAYPEIAIVVPTLNEEPLILSKLGDLRRAEYPHDRITIVVVDGGSTDRTAAIVEREIARGNPIRLVRLDHARSKTDQINHVLGLLPHAIVVVTDADSVLEPSCVAELVSVLADDPQTAVVGALVRPESALLEERIHWWFLNYLWWLEGEVLSAAVVSGVCYAVRREAVLPLTRDARAEDVHLALAAGSRGFRVRICRTARATEIRVPQTAGELVRFRRRRGAVYVDELRRQSPSHAPAGWRLARLIRLWHFAVAPKVGAGLAVAACLLLWTRHWPWPLLTLTAFALPAATALFASRTFAADRRRPWKLGFAATRLLGLLWISLLALGRQPSLPVVSGD